MIGMCWLIMCQAIEDFHAPEGYASLPPEDQLLEGDPRLETRLGHFLPANGMEQMGLWEQMVIVTYYMFTSMSTVGFGDYHPKSDFERVVCSVILVFGVAIFSMIMGNFVAIIETFQTFNDDLDEGEDLLRFCGVLRKFNHGEPLPEAFQRRLEKYFEYRWLRDQNQAVTAGDDVHMFN